MYGIWDTSKNSWWTDRNNLVFVTADKVLAFAQASAANKASRAKEPPYRVRKLSEWFSTEANQEALEL